MANTFNIDPKLDLVLERILEVPPALVWKVWTTPEHLMPWFCPKPWQTVDCEIDLRPGGIFKTVMRSPEGEEFPGTGCYLEIVPEQRITWTSALLPGFRPTTEDPGFLGGYFSASILLEPHAKGTKYTAIAIHGTETSKGKHEEMGFHQGWGTVAEQLVVYAKTLIQ